MWWTICLSHLHLRDKSGAFLKAQRIVTILCLTNVKRARSTWMWCESLLINKPSEKICALAPLTDGKTSEMTNRGKPCLIFFSSLQQSLTHTHPMSSYPEDISLLKQLGVNVGRACHSCEGGTKIMQSITHTISGELWAKLESESEDITKNEKEIVYIVSVSNNGDFLGLTALGADRKTQAITDDLWDFSRTQAWMTGQQSWSLCAQTRLLSTWVCTIALC